MNNTTQWEDYLDLIFDDYPGYVALAAKGTTWEEQQFSWPEGRGRLLRWVSRRVDTANIFICPSLRAEKRRIKGDGISLRWLWADIDWEKVKHPAAVRKALTMLKPATVRSGTGDNVHVYVRLDRAVSVAEHYRLNQGLRDLLEADNKHPDNSLLRLPGTYNRKGRPVEVDWDKTTSKPWAPADLLKIPKIRDTVVTDRTVVSDGTYERVDISTLPNSARRIGRMPVDEAVERYGSRHGAVYQVVQRLIKVGLNRDEIHSVLEDFEAGIEKQDEENGYDLHRDIDRCIGNHPTFDEVFEDDEEEDFEPATEEDVADEEANDLSREADKLIWRRRVQDFANQKIAFQQFMPPPDNTTVLFSDRLEVEPEETRYLIDGLASVGDNITITGQFKTGKTLFVCNLVHSLVEGEPFLAAHGVEDLQDCTVGFWSCEMTQNVLEERYLRPLGFTPDGGSRLAIQHMRGYGISLLDLAGKGWAIKWLRNNDVTVWVVDSFARLCAMAGVEANDNDQVLRLLKTLDEIKRAAGVSELFLIAHTGRGELSRDRARGATVFDDWADARWVLTRDGDIRFLRVEGRDVELPMTSLRFDNETKKLTLGADKDQTRVDTGVQVVVSIVAENPGISKTALTSKIRERKVTGYSQVQDISELIAEAEEFGFVRSSRVEGARGRKMAYHVVADAKDGELGPRTLDFSHVKARQEDGRGRRR